MLINSTIKKLATPPFNCLHRNYDLTANRNKTPILPKNIYYLFIKNHFIYNIYIFFGDNKGMYFK